VVGIERRMATAGRGLLIVETCDFGIGTAGVEERHCRFLPFRGIAVTVAVEVDQIGQRGGEVCGFALGTNRHTISIRLGTCVCGRS
jgi:hypothetical protein